MYLEDWRKKNKISYYNLGQMLHYKGINPAASAQKICLTCIEKRFPKPHVVEKIREITKKEVDYKDLYDAYFEATK